MTDRELLELAAKAAGIEIEWHIMINSSRHPIVAPKTQLEKQWLGHDYTEWDPLDDDGDALRLAVRLHINIELNNGSATAVWFDLAASETHVVEEPCDEEFEGWPAKEAATRRAIVRAAAEIGRSMP